MVGQGRDERKLGPTDVAIAGGASGILTRLLTQPLDVVKVRFQLQMEPIHNQAINSKYKSTLQALKVIFEEEGVKGLWKGHNPGQLLSLSYGAVQFSVYEALSTATSIWFNGERTAFMNFVNGSLAGSISTFATIPFDVLKTRFIAQGNQKMYRHMWHAASEMYTTEGLRSFYKGLSPTLILVTPQTGAQFMFYGLMSKLLKKFSLTSRNHNQLNVLGDLISGSTAGVLAKTVVYPLDLARKRLQLQGFQKARHGFGQNFVCHGLRNCLSQTYKEEGFLSLFKGLSPSIAKAAITTAMYFTFYNQLCILLANIKNV